MQNGNTDNKSKVVYLADYIFNKQKAELYGMPALQERLNKIHQDLKKINEIVQELKDKSK